MYRQVKDDQVTFTVDPQRVYFRPDGYVEIGVLQQFQAGAKVRSTLGWINYDPDVVLVSGVSIGGFRNGEGVLLEQIPGLPGHDSAELFFVCLR